MATFKTAASNGIYAKLVITEQSQSIENNTTTLKWEVYMWNTTASPNWYMYDQHNIFRVKINNVSVLDTNDFGRVSLQYEQTESTARLITSGTTVIAHETDGTKKSVPVSFYAAQGWEYAYVWETSGTMNLTTIARASQPTLSASSVTLGSPVTIYTNRASTGFTHTLEYSIGSASGTIASGVGDRYDDWKPSKELARQFPNAQSGTVTITCKTYNGSTLIGSKTVLLNVKISSDMIPSVSATISEAASIPSGITGYIKSRSKLKITVSASGIYGSTIKSYKITANGATYTATPAVTGYLTTEGTNTITVTVTDSRGQSKTYSTTVTVLDYSPPRADMVNAFRANSSGVSDEEGSYMMVEVVSTITSLGGANGRSVTVETRPSGGSWTSREIYVSDGYEGFASWTHGGTIWVDTATSYEARVRVSDSFGSSSYYYATVSTASILMNIHVGENGVKDGMAIGKMAEKAKTVQLGWDLEVFDQPANTVLAAPNGSDGVAQFRKLSETDIDPAWLPTQIYPSGAGWYRIFTSQASATDASGLTAVEFKLGRTYNSPRNEIYQFAISVSYAGNIDITQLSGDIGGHLITKIRVLRASSKIFYIDFYANAGASNYENSYYVYGICGHGTFCAPTPATIPDGYSAVEFDTVNGCKNNRGFTGNLYGNATSATTAGYATNAGDASWATHSGRMLVNDIRDTSGIPTQYYGQSLTAFFNNTDLPPGLLNWKSGIHVKGWSSDYAAWELVSESTDRYNVDGALYFRRGANASWGSWHMIESAVSSSFMSGTSGIWHYVKYASGLAMCWGNTGICNTDFTATWSSWYIHDYLFPAQRYPFDFVAKPQVFASQGKGGTTKCDWAIYSGGDAGGYSDTQYSPVYSVFRPKTTGATVNLSLDLFAIGRWK